MSASPIPDMPNFEKPQINYPDGNDPEFKYFKEVVYMSMVGTNSFEENRFKTISDFKDCINRNGEVEFEWDGKNYSITHPDKIRSAKRTNMTQKNYATLQMKFWSTKSVTSDYGSHYTGYSMEPNNINKILGCKYCFLIAHEVLILLTFLNKCCKNTRTTENGLNTMFKPFFLYDGNGENMG